MMIISLKFLWRALFITDKQVRLKRAEVKTVHDSY